MARFCQETEGCVRRVHHAQWLVRKILAMLNEQGLAGEFDSDSEEDREHHQHPKLRAGWNR